MESKVYLSKDEERKFVSMSFCGEVNQSDLDTGLSEYLHAVEGLDTENWTLALNFSRMEVCSPKISLGLEQVFRIYCDGKYKNVYSYFERNILVKRQVERLSANARLNLEFDHIRGW